LCQSFHSAFPQKNFYKKRSQIERLSQKLVFAQSAQSKAAQELFRTPFFAFVIAEATISQQESGIRQGFRGTVAVYAFDACGQNFAIRRPGKVVRHDRIPLFTIVDFYCVSEPAYLSQIYDMDYAANIPAFPAPLLDLIKCGIMPMRQD
jgi:hypothetical protein